jgi:hypothetical protein
MAAREDALLTFTPQGVRKKSATPLIRAPTAITPVKLEASLSDEQFENVLRTLRAIGQSMERTPAAFAKLDEEELRSVFLAALNAQFEGGATGESFNAEGKTDILIRHEDKNLFIGECKIWGGPVSLSKAVDQVLGYLCWRDSRAAILIFVRGESMSVAVSKIPHTIASHSNYLREIRTVGETEWHYDFCQKDDAERHLTLGVLAFHFRT